MTVSAPDLEFAFENTLYATHGLHPYAAKCPPPLARWAIEQFSGAGELVLDPMVGSGTTLVEARLLGRHSIGVDIDALACLLTRVKSTPLGKETLEPVIDSVLDNASHYFSLWRKQRSRSLYPDPSEIWDLPAFHNRDYWFSPEVSAALWCLKSSIDATSAGGGEKAFLYLLFSSLIIAKKSVANARDIVHSRHHYYRHASLADVFAKFRQRAKRTVRAMEAFVEGCQDLSTTSHVLLGDGRQLPFADSSFDLVFTSPPYCNAIDYPRAHRLTVGWLQDVLHIEFADYKRLGRCYVGAERALRNGKPDINSDCKPLLAEAQAVIEKMEHNIYSHSAGIIRRYFEDMSRVVAEMARVVKPDRRIVLVVCPSNILKVAVPTHDLLAEIAEHTSTRDGHYLSLEHMWSRTIADRKRLLPYMQERFGPRMRTEYVLVFQKRAGRCANK